MKRAALLLGLLAALSLAPARSQAVPLTIETFDDPHDWVSGGGPGGIPPAPLPVQPDGGPAGASDPFLLIESTGTDGPGSRLSAINMGDWTGDYLAAGITQIRGDVNNLGATDLYLRLLFVDFGAAGPVGLAFTTDYLFVPGGSGWQGVSFDVSPSALTALLGTAEGVLANVDELRLYHNPNPGFTPGEQPAIAASLGVDNLQAVGVAAVPEPAAISLLLAAVVARAVRRRA